MTHDALFSRFGRTFSAGTVLFREGEPGAEMFVIQSGRVAVTRRVLETDRLLATLGPGDFFGEMALLSARPRTATVTALDELRCVVLGAEALEAMVRSNAEIAVRLIKKLGERLEAADAQIEALMQPDGHSRLVHRLASLAQSQAEPVEEGLLLRFDPGQLATELALAPGELEAGLGKLARARLAATRPEGLLVPDLGELRDYLDFLDKRVRYADL